MSNIFKSFMRQPHSTFTLLAPNIGEDGGRPGGTPIGPAEAPRNGRSGQAELSAVPSPHAARSPEFDEWAEKPLRVRSVRLSAMCPLMSPAEKHSYAAEQYRIVRTKTVQLLPKPFQLVITSPSIGDGKTLTAVNMAVAMAMRSNERTLLIDADLRRAAVHRSLDVPLEPGLSDVLAGTCRLEEAMFATEGLPGLCVIPAGNPHTNPTELLDSSRWSELTQAMRRHFAHVIVDSPPLEVVADYDLIAASCDGVILVVRPDISDRTLCLAAIEKLQPKLTGVLVNAAPEWFLWKQRGYGGYYSYRPDVKESKHGQTARPE